MKIKQLQSVVNMYKMKPQPQNAILNSIAKIETKQKHRSLKQYLKENKKRDF